MRANAVLLYQGEIATWNGSRGKGAFSYLRWDDKKCGLKQTAKNAVIDRETNRLTIRMNRYVSIANPATPAQLAAPEPRLYAMKSPAAWAEVWQDAFTAKVIISLMKPLCERFLVQQSLAGDATLRRYTSTYHIHMADAAMAHIVGPALEMKRSQYVNDARHRISKLYKRLWVRPNHAFVKG